MCLVELGCQILAFGIRTEEKYIFFFINRFSFSRRLPALWLGHCPHDEVPEESNALLMHFARSSGREGMEIGRQRSTEESEVGGDGILDVIVEEAMLSVGGKDAIGKES